MQFNQGILYWRLEDNKLAALFFTEETIPADYQRFNNLQIAEMRFGSLGEPSFIGYTECARPGLITGSGMIVTFKKAEDEDIEFLLKNWNTNYPIAGWVRGVQREEKLSTEEKNRIKRIAEKFIS